MIDQDGVLVQLIRLVDRIPTPPPPPRRPRGRPVFYSERLFMKALVIMIVRRLHKVGELFAVLEEDTPEMRGIRNLLQEDGHFPSRRTFERRLKALPEKLPEQIGCLGTHLVAAQTVGQERQGGGHRRHAAKSQGRRVAQERQRSWQSALHRNRHRGRLDQERLARVGLWVEATPRHLCGIGVDPVSSPAHPG